MNYAQNLHTYLSITFLEKPLQQYEIAQNSAFFDTHIVFMYAKMIYVITVFTLF
jgi:hypothetical protein